MILAVIEATMGSTRMPAKLIAPVLGEPLICRQIERVKRARTIDKTVVATGQATGDDPLVGLLLGRGCSVFRGSDDDVLGRIAACARGWAASHVVRLKGDCPLVDPQVIDRAVGLALSSDAAYCGNIEVPTYPAGLEVEVITADALAAADREAVDSADRHDVTAYIRRFPLRFHQAQLTCATDRSHLSWAVDGPEDFAFVRELFRRFYPQTPDFGLEEIAELCAAEPGLAAHSMRAA